MHASNLNLPNKIISTAIKISKKKIISDQIQKHDILELIICNFFFRLYLVLCLDGNTNKTTSIMKVHVSLLAKASPQLITLLIKTILIFRDLSIHGQHQYASYVPVYDHRKIRRRKIQAVRCNRIGDLAGGGSMSVFYN